jgi:hypothetical protein
VRGVKQAVWRVAATGVNAGRVALRARGKRFLGRREGRLVFVVGSPRSGTTFVGGALGSQPGFVDLGEVPLLKAAVPRLVARPVEEQARAIRRIVQPVRNLALVHGLRAVEQNPETSFVLAGALRAPTMRIRPTARTRASGWSRSGARRSRRRARPRELRGRGGST